MEQKRYKILTTGLGKFPEIQIDHEQFEKLKLSSKILSKAISIEEKYEILISNFLELEKEALAISAEDMIRRQYEYTDYFVTRSTLNRRVINLLSSTKLYIDQILQDVKVFSKSLANELKESLSSEYDVAFEYRFMEALRNYVQHQGLAVHLTSHQMKWTEKEDSRQLRFRTKIFSRRKDFEYDKAFKRSVYKEMPEKVEILEAARVYISAISRVHNSVREKTQTVVDDSREEIYGVLNQYDELCETDVVGVSAIAYLDGATHHSEVKEQIPLFLVWDDVRLKLVKKNPCIKNLEKRFVSSEGMD